MDVADVPFAGLAAQARLVRDGELAARELVALALERIAALGTPLNAFSAVLAERALADADAADARRRSGDDAPLLGVPVAIKDNIDVAGVPTQRGTASDEPPAAEDAEVVRRLRAAGAIVLAKTRVPELSCWPFTESAAYGATRNPWDLGRTPGGSSGGSAAAVAAGIVPAALGSDGAGSIRVPAACCGLFGLKPQRDRVPLAPHHDAWQGLAVYGPLTRRVADAALLLDATGDRDPGGSSFAAAASRSPGRLRIAVSTRPAVPGIPLYPAIRRALDETVELLGRLGHDLRARDPAYAEGVPHVFARFLRGLHDEAVGLAQPERLEQRTRRLLRLGGAIPQGVVARIRAQERRLALHLGAVWDDNDLLLTPTLPRPALPIGYWEGRGALWTLNGASRWVTYLGLWNATGQPAASVPAGFDSDGLPLAVQLVARPRDESTLLSLAAQLEAERPWADRRPPVS